MKAADSDATEAGLSSTRRQRRPRVLLVNDDEDSLFLLGRAVRRALPEAEVALLRDATTALRYFGEHHVDAVVTDNKMPVMDGLTFVRQVRARDQRVPILLVTSSAELSREAAAAGVTSYLPCARWNDVGESLRDLLM
jgi:CheY-like chemotaxis protein